MLAVGLMLVVGILLLFLRLKKPLPPTTHAKTIVILGSGGHTTEMIQLLDSLLRCRRYSPRVYVVASTDILSCHKAYEMERDLGAEMNGDGLYSEVDEFIDEFDIFQFHIVKIPRSREILCNGPGTCVPICLTALLLNALGWGVRMVYVESFARVYKLSLSGRILYPFVNTFIVQWPQILPQYPRAILLESLH